MNPTRCLHQLSKPILAITFLLGVTLASAGDADRALVRVTHLSPNSPPFDFCDNGELFGRNIGYRRTTGYEPVPTGANANVFTRSFAGHRCIADLVLNSNTFPPLFAGDHISATAIGDFFAEPPVTALVGPPALITFDDNSPAPGGTAKVRFFNLALNGGSVDLRTGDGAISEDTVPITTGTVLPPGASVYEIVPKGRYRLSVTETGGGPALAHRRVTLQEQGVYTVFFIGDTAGGLGLAIAVTRDDKRRGRFLR